MVSPSKLDAMPGIFKTISTPIPVDPRFATDRQLLIRILELLEKIMATLNDVQMAVAAEDSVVDSAITLLKGLAAQVAALQPNQAAIDALAADITAKTQSLADAVVQNTPAGP
jgi:hypothetical protein